MNNMNWLIFHLFIRLIKFNFYLLQAITKALKKIDKLEMYVNLLLAY